MESLPSILIVYSEPIGILKNNIHKRKVGQPRYLLVDFLPDYEERTLRKKVLLGTWK